MRNFVTVISIILFYLTRMEIHMVEPCYPVPVCPVNGLLYGLEALDGLDGAEYLLPADLHVVGDVSKHGRLHKEALLSVPGGATKI